MNEPNVKRGDIFYADLDPVVGSEQGGLRPVLVIQNDVGNHHSPTVIVAALTSRQKKPMPTHLELSAEHGLARDSVVLLEQIRTIDKKRLKERVGRVPDEILDKVDGLINLSLGTKEIKPMNELIKIESHYGRLTVGSREVAENFEKDHKHVLEAIRNLVAENPATKSMLFEHSYENRGKQYPEYLLTRDGFSLLVMGFTGAKALEWKLKYIEAFNKMESEVKERTVDYSGLSPELQAIRTMIDDMARQKVEIKQISNTVTTIKDTILTNPNNWREDLNHMFNKIVQAVGDGRFRELRHESYQFLESRARVDLERRLMNMKARMLKQGMSKSAIDKVNKLDVIESDPKLREIYTAIVREYTIKYVA